MYYIDILYISNIKCQECGGVELNELHLSTYVLDNGPGEYAMIYISQKSLLVLYSYASFLNLMYMGSLHIRNRLYLY